MTIEHTVTFGVEDLTAISVACTQCKTVISFSDYEAANRAVFCPGCSGDGALDGVIWTERDVEQSPAKALVLALLHARGNRHAATVRMSAAIDKREEAA